MPPLAFEDTHITVVWEKPSSGTAASYNIYANGNKVGSVSKIAWPANSLTNLQLFFDITGLTPSTSYSILVRAVDASGIESPNSNTVVQATTATPTTINVTSAPYSAVGNGTTTTTAALQSAINACPSGGKVLFPSGNKFLSGALYLKSNCTYEIEGTLLASGKTADYQAGNNRFPIYGTGGVFGSVKYADNYKGLLNTCGTPTTTDNSCVGVQNIRLTGAGTVQGNTSLASAEGTDARGDLVNFAGIKGLYIAGLTFNQSSEHMLFVARSSNITIAKVNVQSKGISNGDGIDLVTAYADQLTSNGPVGLLPTNAYIFGSTWNTGDDCINLNAGTSAPGVAVGTPINGVHVFNNYTQAGHGGVVWGSFTAAGFKNVSAVENSFDGTDVGLRFKTGSGHGGGIATLSGNDFGALAKDNKVNNVGTGIVITNAYPDTTGMPAAPMGVFHDIVISGLAGTASAAFAVDTGTKLTISTSMTGSVSISGVTNSVINGVTYP
ncbi:MAG TPA: fibronectin type III domain-containing protein [Rhodocyclaceae bacterium]|nr:fibronectin type III domain-containing protein [Rhodocyclaceae bacterium]